MTPTEISAHAIELGITPELYSELWRRRTHSCSECELDHLHDSCPRCGSSLNNGPLYTCTLPDPDSDDPRACLWEPFYMRALGWRATVLRLFTEYKIEGIGKTWRKTPTAALRAAWLWKGAKT